MTSHEAVRRRPRRAVSGIAQLPWRRLVDPFRPLEVLSVDQVEAVHLASLRILLNTEGKDEAAVRAAWDAAQLGLDPTVLTQAIAGAAASKAALTDPEQKRWGQYSIQRVFLDFLEQIGLREERVPSGRGEVQSHADCPWSGCEEEPSHDHHRASEFT